MKLTCPSPTTAATEPGRGMPRCTERHSGSSCRPESQRRRQGQCETRRVGEGESARNLRLTISEVRVHDGECARRALFWPAAGVGDCSRVERWESEKVGRAK